MKTKNFKQAPSFPAEPKQVFKAWLDSETHGEMIDGQAKIEPRAGGKFTIWDGSVDGKTLSIDYKKLRIIQEWRYDYDDWPKDQPSKITLEFVKDRRNPEHTRLRFWHSNVPEKYADDIAQGWKDYYWTPMQKYFA